MKKRTAIFVGILAMLAVITSVGLTAKKVIETPMIEKPIQKLPIGRVEYKELTEEEMAELQKALENLEEPTVDVEEDITIEE